MEIADHDPSIVDRRNGLLEFRRNVDRPRCIALESARIRSERRQRVALGHHLADQLAVDELEDEEMVVAEDEVIVQRRYCIEARKPLHHVALTLEACHGIGALGGKSRVRPCLFQNNPLAGSGVGSQIQTTTVREVDRLVDLVGDLVELRVLARGEMRLQACGQRNPRWNPERRFSAIGDVVPVRIADRCLELPARTHAPLIEEAAVARIQRTVPPTEVTQDVRPGLPVKQGSELGCDRFELLVVTWKDRDQLAARSAIRVFRIAEQKKLTTPHELERDVSRDAVVPHDRYDLFCIVERSR